MHTGVAHSRTASDAKSLSIGSFFIGVHGPESMLGLCGTRTQTDGTGAMDWCWFDDVLLLFVAVTTAQVHFLCVVFCLQLTREVCVKVGVKSASAPARFHVYLCVVCVCVCLKCVLFVCDDHDVFRVFVSTCVFFDIFQVQIGIFYCRTHLSVKWIV